MRLLIEFLVTKINTESRLDLSKEDTEWLMRALMKQDTVFNGLEELLKVYREKCIEADPEFESQAISMMVRK